MDNFVCFSFRCLVILFILRNVSSDSSNCFDEYCFTYPDLTLSFDPTISWCANNNLSTLAVVNNKSSQDALIQFLSSSNKPSPLYVNAKLDQRQESSWFLISGEKFSGNVENQTDIENMYKFYTFLQIGSPTFVVRASSPQEQKSYICKYKNYSGINILPNTSNSDNGTVFVKYENETLNWFEARNRCYLRGGDLATFSSLSNFNTTWLNLSFSYWIGIRWSNRLWKSMYDNQEIIYTRWSNGKPNSSSLQCVCIDEKSPWNWTDCDCSTQRSFVCAKYRDPATAKSRTTTLSSLASFPSETSVHRAAETSNRNSTQDLRMPIGVGVGVGGCVLIILVVVVVIIVIKTRKSKESTTDPTKTKTEGKPRKGPKSHKKPKETKVTKPTNNSPDYAEIQAVSRHVLREPTKEPVVYSTPEFVENN